MVIPPQKNKNSFLRLCFLAILAGMISLVVIQAYAFRNPCGLPLEKPEGKKDPEQILRNIYKEVSELGKRKDEHFIKREFHFDLDENPTNSEEHIVVLIYDIKEKEKMVVQVTYFETDGLRYSVKYAKDIKLVSCLIDSESLKIDTCDFTKKEMKPLFSDILKGIQEEKELFKLIEKKKIENSGIKKNPST